MHTCKNLSSFLPQQIQHLTKRGGVASESANDSDFLTLLSQGWNMTDFSLEFKTHCLQNYIEFEVVNVDVMTLDLD